MVRITHAVVLRGRAGAIVTVVHADDGKVICTAIERHPFDIEPVVGRVRDLRDEDPDCSIVIDAEGLGDAAWQLLDRPRRKRGFRLYEKHGIERAELTRELLVAIARKSIRFPSDLPEAEAMKTALLGLSRDVREDGPGSELCVALSLAISDRPRPKPRVHGWTGPPPETVRLVRS